jgi:hypothetical protein
MTDNISRCWSDMLVVVSREPVRPSRVVSTGNGNEETDVDTD